MNHKVIDFDLISEDGDDAVGISERMQVLIEAENNFIEPHITYPPPMEIWFSIDQEVNEYLAYWGEYEHLNGHLEGLYQEYREKFKKEIVQEFYKRIFRNQIAEELIAAAMNPNRIQKIINQSDDIESFFTMV